MFIKIKATNVGAISNTIEIDLIAKSRKMKDNIFIYETFDGLFINKLIGICGANASGKSTFISILNSVGNFLFQTKRRNLYLKHIAELKLHDKINTNFFNELLLNFDELEISESNVDRQNEPTNIYIELYIDTDEKTRGYYFYELEYLSSSIDEKGVIFEKLYYKDKYNSNKKFFLIDIQNNKESQIGYLNQYYENEKEVVKDEDLNKKMPYIKAFYNFYISRCLTFRDNYERNMSLLDLYGDNLEFLNQIISVIDPNIREATLELSEDNKNIVFLTKHNSKLRLDQLSNGTIRLLAFLRHAYSRFTKGGICLIDEIETGLHLSLVKFIILLTSISEKNQLIFTTHNSDIFEFLDSNEENKIFKMDQVYYILKENDNTDFRKLSDIKVENFNNRTDVKFSNVYKHKEIIFQPNDEQLYNCLNILQTNKNEKGDE